MSRTLSNVACALKGRSCPIHKQDIGIANVAHGCSGRGFKVISCGGYFAESCTAVGIDAARFIVDIANSIACSKSVVTRVCSF